MGHEPLTLFDEAAGETNTFLQRAQDIRGRCGSG
jgi:hypothetical protein